MKYFIGNPTFIDRPDLEEVISRADFEVEKNQAREMYMIWGEHNDYSNDALEQLPLAFWKQGKRVTMKHYDLWGEDIGDNELFKRRLTGKLAKEVIK